MIMGTFGTRLPSPTPSLLPEPHSGRRALVLGGGGLVGVNWEIGVLTGLAAEGYDLSGPLTDGGLQPERILGTSAGSMVGSLMTHRSLEELRELAHDDSSTEIIAESLPVFDLETMAECFQVWQAAGEPDVSTMAAIGAFALSARTIPEARFLESMLNLCGTDWSDPRFVCTAVNAATGEPVLLSHQTKVPLGSAVAASCSVPAMFPPITLQVGAEPGRYTDGGVRSGTSIDYLHAFERVLVLAPMGSFLGESLDASAAAAVQRETTVVEANGGQVVTLFTDDATNEATMFSPLTRMEPTARIPAFEHGVRQGRLLAGQLNNWW
jgi:NTE family protein